MNRSIKAALISAFVLPGAGHLYLKKYVPGLGLAATSLVAVYYMISDTVNMALDISDKILAGNTQLDMASITQAAAQQSVAADGQQLSIMTIALTICWIIGIVDSYRAGRLQDKNNKNL